MKRASLLVKAGFSVLFFLLIMGTVRRGELRRVLAAVDWKYVALSFGVAAVMIGSSCAKWQFVLRARGHRVGFLTLLRIYFIGYFFTSMLPSNIGGDVVRSYYAGKLIGSQSDAAAAVFVERFSGILFLLVLAVLSPALKPELYGHPLVIMPALGAAGLLGVVVWMWFRRDPLAGPEKFVQGLLRASESLLRSHPGAVARVFNRAAGWIAGRLFASLRSFQEKVGRLIRYLRDRPRGVLWLVALTVWFYFLTWINVYVSFRAFGVDPGFWNTAALVPVCMLMAMLPVTFLGNLGFTEGVYVTYFHLIGVSSASSLAMGLLLRFKLLCVGSIGCILYLSYRGRAGTPPGGRGDAGDGENGVKRR